LRQCASCGTELPDRARYCRLCGERLSAQRPAGEITVKRKALALAESPANKASTRVTRQLSLDEESGVQEAEARTSQSEAMQPMAEQEEAGPLPALRSPVDSAQPHNGQVHEQQQVSELPTIKLGGVEQQPAPATQPVEAPLPTMPGPDPAPAYTGGARRSSVAMRLIVSIVVIVLIAAGAGTYILLAHPFTQATTAAPVVASSPGANVGTTPRPVVTACPASASSNCTTPTGTPGGAGASKVALTFSDAVTGQIAVTTVVSCGAEQSPAGGQQYHLSVLGTIGGRQYGFAFVVYPYTIPTTYTGAVASFFGPAGANSSLAEWRSHAPAGASVTVNNNTKSGTIDISLSSTSDHSSVNVVGSWTCE
jgi:hypothetical protein